MDLAEALRLADVAQHRKTEAEKRKLAEEAERRLRELEQARQGIREAQIKAAKIREERAKVQKALASLELDQMLPRDQVAEAIKVLREGLVVADSSVAAEAASAARLRSGIPRLKEWVNELREQAGMPIQEWAREDPVDDDSSFFRDEVRAACEAAAALPARLKPVSDRDKRKACISAAAGRIRIALDLPDLSDPESRALSKAFEAVEKIEQDAHLLGHVDALNKNTRLNWQKYVRTMDDKANGAHEPLGNFAPILAAARGEAPAAVARPAPRPAAPQPPRPAAPQEARPAPQRPPQPKKERPEERPEEQEDDEAARHAIQSGASKAAFGKSLAIVGGMPMGELESWLRENLGLKKAKWYECYRSHDEVESLVRSMKAGGVDGVVVMTSFIPRGRARDVVAEARTARVRCVNCLSSNKVEIVDRVREALTPKAR